jgi:hypothetical protein
MATLARSAPLEHRDRLFLFKLNAGLAIFTVGAFVQWTARGFVTPSTLPWWVHAHGVAMVLWLGLSVVQSYLVLAGRAGMHRQLGWAAAGLLPVLAVLGLATGYESVALHRVPPFWTNAFLLALASVSVCMFVSLAVAGLILRRQTHWHRRLMIGATIVILTAAFDRTLPAGALGAARPLYEGALQLFVVGILAVHDWRARGTVHPATVWVAAAVVANHAAIAGLTVLPPFIALADGIAA